MMKNPRYTTTNQVVNQILANARRAEEQRQRAKPAVDWVKLPREEFRKELRKIGVETSVI